MRRLFLYFNLAKQLDPESEKLQRIQIDWCLYRGMKKSDIVFVSNIPFEYNGVSSILYEPKSFPDFIKHVKGWFITELYNEGILDGTYWLTDHDLFQVGELDRSEPEGDVDLCTYGVETTGRIPHPANEVNLCSAIISGKSVAFFLRLHNMMATAKGRKLKSEERAATALNDSGMHILNKRYNLFAWRNLKEQYEIATLPLIGIHFHPANKWAIKTMCTTCNTVGIQFAPDELVKIITEQGFII